MATVTILRGKFRNQTIRNHTFELLKGLTKTAGGAFHLTVDGTSLSGLRTARIKVKTSADYVINGELPVPSKEEKKLIDLVATAAKDEHPVVVAVDDEERRAEILKRINGRFETLEKLTRAAKEGNIRSIVVSGAPGVGKTYGVEQVLSDDTDYSAITYAALGEDYSSRAPKPVKSTFEFVTGSITPPSLYIKLYNNRHANNVLVFDDADRIFEEVDSINLMKAALDTKKKRTICWNVDSFQIRKQDGIPARFDFEASVIFISNENFKKPSKSKISDHIAALMNRSHFLDLTVHTLEEKLLRIEYMVTTKGMLDSYGLDEDTKVRIMDFVKKNAALMDTRPQILSLRSVVKMAELALAFPAGEEWMDVAFESLCVKNY